MDEKIDLKKQWKKFYSSVTRPEIVEVPSFNYLMIDGKGNPNTAEEYKLAVSSLFQLAYALKFTIKRSLGIDYGVMPLEGLWWTEDMATFSVEHKEEWLWTMMIHQPEWVTSDLVEIVRRETIQKKGPGVLDKITFSSFAEGLSVQILHTGPYAAETENIAWLHRVIHENHYQPTGKHHEIYLSDVTKTAPEKLKTILRQPISEKQI